MEKYYGKIGYYKTSEKAAGVYTPDIVEREYFGDVLEDRKRYSASDKVNDDIAVSCRISLIADPYAFENYYHIKYVTYMGAKWKVSDVDIKAPRLILTLGGLYNG